MTKKMNEKENPGEGGRMKEKFYWVDGSGPTG